MRPKTRRRLTVLLSLAIIGVGSLGGIYEFRQHQFNTRLMADRAAGLAAYRAADYPDALKDLARYNQYDQSDPQTLFAFAKARSRVELPDDAHLLEAINYYRRGLLLDPKNQVAKHELLAIYSNPYVAYDAEAVTLCDELLKTNPDDTEALRAKATALYRLHKLNDAMAVADRLTKIAPTDMRGQQLSYELMYQLNRPADKIVARAEKDFKAHPNDPRFEMLLGYAYMLAGQFDQSRTYLIAAAHAKETDPVAVEELCGMLDSLHLYDESNALLARSAEQTADPQMQQMLIRRLWQTGDFSQVVTRSKNLSLTDGDSQLLAYDAMSHYQLNQRSDADKIVAALKLRTHDDVAMAWAKAISAQFAQPALAPTARVARFESALSRDPSNAVIRDMLGSAYAELGESQPALQQWKIAEDAEPSWAQPRTQTARLLAATGRDQMAIDEAQKAYDRAQNVGSAIGLVVAWSQAAQQSDDPNIARRVLALVNEIQAKIPDEPQTLPIYVAMLARTGQRTKAIDVLRSALTSQRVMDDSTLIALAGVSRSARLGMDKEILQRAQQLHGLTPALALAIASDTSAAGDAKGAEATLRKQVAAAQSQHIAWQLALAEFLESVHSPSAAQVWIDLGNANPADLRVQGTITDLPEAATVWKDRAFIQTTIDRLKAITGDQGQRWQLAQARWLLDSPKKQRDSAAAVVLLTELVRTSPDMLLPRVYLTRALENIHEPAQAIDQLKNAAEIDPDSPTIALHLVKLMESQAQFAAAMPYLDKLAQNKTLSSDQRLQVALLQAASGQRDAALQMLGQNGGAAGLALRAELLRQRGELTAASQLYRQIVSMPDSEPQSLVEAAEFFAEHGENADAQSAIKALNQRDMSPEKRAILTADYDEDRGDVAAAEALLKSATAEHGDAAAWGALAGFEFRQDHDAAALDAAQHGGDALTDLKTDIQQMGRKQVKLTDRTLRDALSRDPADIAGRQTLAALTQPGTLDHVANQLEACADKFPNFMPAQTLAFEAALKLQQLDEAMQIANRCAQGFPNDPEAAEMPVVVHAAAGQWSDMLLSAQMWRKCSADNPMRADLAIAEAEMQMAEPDQAVKQLAPYVSFAMKDPDAHANVIGDYCRALVLNGQQSQAAAILHPLVGKKQWRMLWLKLAAQVPGADSAAKWIAQVEGAIPKTDMAEQQSLAGAWYELGVRYGYAGGFANARRVIAPIAALPNAPASAQLLMAASCEKLADRPAAVAAYRKALQIDPNLPLAQNNLAYDLLMQNENLKEARELAEKAVAAHADDAAYRDTLGQILLRLGDRQGAIQTYQTLVQMQPNNVSAQITLAQTLLADGKRDSASRVVAQIDSILQTSPGSTSAYQQDLQALHQSLTK